MQGTAAIRIRLVSRLRLDRNGLADHVWLMPWMLHRLHRVLAAANQHSFCLLGVPTHRAIPAHRAIPLIGSERDDQDNKEEPEILHGVLSDFLHFLRITSLSSAMDTCLSVWPRLFFVLALV